MATITKTEMICDITGEEAAESITFSVGDQGYHIDLSEKKAQEFHEALAPFIAFAQVATKTKAKTRKSSGPTTDSALIRTWARANGWANMGERGRISTEVRQAYTAATASNSVPAVPIVEFAPGE